MRREDVTAVPRLKAVLQTTNETSSAVKIIFYKWLQRLYKSEIQALCSLWSNVEELKLKATNSQVTRSKDI
jgi:hypothetical protein